MKMIHPSVTTIREKNPFKKIEIVGRTCYKSSSEMTDATAREFYKKLVSRKHFAMLEHASFIFEVSNRTLYDYIKESCNKVLHSEVDMFTSGKFMNFTDFNDHYLISGNLRSINDSRCQPLLKCLYTIDLDLVYAVYFPDVEEDIEGSIRIFPEEDLTSAEFMYHFYFTQHFICDRGVSHEIVRHRPASYAQESTRYCNYSLDKFGGELTFIYPADYDNFNEDCKSFINGLFQTSEFVYCHLIKKGLSPQQARAVLPTGVKTEIIMTAPAFEWEHFFNLRKFGTTGAPHPDMKVVADMAFENYKPYYLSHVMKVK